MAADSFNGIATFQVIDGSQDEDSILNFALRPIPGGNTFYYDIGGQLTTTRKLLLRFTNDADYQAFRGQRGNTGTLVCFDMSAPALLLEVHRTYRNPPGSSTEAEATFVLL